MTHVLWCNKSVSTCEFLNGRVSGAFVTNIRALLPGADWKDIYAKQQKRSTCKGAHESKSEVFVLLAVRLQHASEICS